MKVLVVLGHPRPGSLSSALADAYCDGARTAGVVVRLLRLAELDFECDVLESDPRDQALEPDLEEAKALVAWADHVVFVYPTWWGTVPARLKGFLDRILLPGFAFSQREGGGYVALLGGKTSEFLTTMDTPGWVYRWIYGAPGHRALARATLGFCGIETVRITGFGPVNTSSQERRTEWIGRARHLGERMGRGARTRRQVVRHGAGKWLKALRPQFYPVTVLGYLLGALAAAQEVGFHRGAFWFGLFCLLGLKVATVFINEIADRPGDEVNRHWSPFTGGSRSLVEGRLGEREMWVGTAWALGVAAMAAAGLLWTTPGSTGEVLVLLVVVGGMALGYSLPPLRLSSRGLGEVTVAATHGPGVVLWGFVGQGGGWSHPVPWLLGLLIGLSVLPAIILSGIPDRSADASVGKGTLVVRMGTRGGTRLALIATALAAVATGASLTWTSLEGLTGGLPLLGIPHAVVIAALLTRYQADGAPERRIDGLMAGSLLFILWFVVVPLWNVGRG